jgi:elongation factor P
MLNYSELDKKNRIMLNGQPYEIIEARSMFTGRSHSVLNTKLRNLRTGKVISKTFHPGDSVEEADINKMEAKFIYNNRGKFVFCEKGNPANRFELEEDQIGDQKDFLKPNQVVEALLLEDEVINISLPIKVELKVKMAPPSLKGESATGGKMVTLETGAKLNTPTFIETGDIVEVNTETGEYSRRIEK